MEIEPRERVFAALQHREPDRVPRFEIWIDASLGELGQPDPASAYVKMGRSSISEEEKAPATPPMPEY